MPQMVRMIATSEHQYFGRRIQKGTEYDCQQQHVEVMQKQGWARPKEEAQADQADAGQYRTRHMVAATPRGPRKGRT